MTGSKILGSFLDTPLRHDLLSGAMRQARIGNGLRELALWRSFFISHAYVFKKHPDLLLQEAANQPIESSIASAARNRLQQGPHSKPWLEWMNPDHHGLPVATLTGHLSSVTSCEFAPDGSRIASASFDGTLRIWDSGSGRELTICKVDLTGAERGVHACAFLPDGRSIVSAGGDGTLRIWDTATGQELMELVGHEDAVLACAISPDGQQILSLSCDQTLRVWDATSGEIVSSRQTER